MSLATSRLGRRKEDAEIMDLPRSCDASPLLSHVVVLYASKYTNICVCKELGILIFQASPVIVILGDLPTVKS